MPTQQLVYEGADLPVLIQQVVDEHGPARIRPPERRRKGGLFGFFSREVYVIAVDPAATEKAAAEQPSPAPETCATNPAGVAPASGRSIPPASLAALADETEDELSLGNGGAASAPSPWESPAPALTASAGTGSPSRIVKPFSQVLSEVASSLGEEPGTYRPDPEKLRRITPLVPPAAPRPAAPATPVVTNPAAAPGAPAATTPTTPAPTSTPAPVLAAPATLTLVPAPATGERPAAAGEATTAPPPPVLDGALLEVLRAAGAPESLLGRVQGTDRGRPTLEGALAVMTEAPPLPGVAGALVAVVGDARLARSVTRAVASAVGCPADQVAVAARSAGARNHAPGLRVTTSEQAAALAPGWRRGKVAVVTVHAPPVGADQQWTRDVLAALQPSCVWALASATTKPDDVRRFTEDIGGADALALTDVALTGTPAAVLSAGVPVARLDEEPATPARWAAVVADLVARR